jgi:hypothetical protein
MSRRFSAKDAGQRDAVREAREPRNCGFVLHALGALDPGVKLDADKVGELLELFNDVFLPGKIAEVEFAWASTYSDARIPETALAWTSVRYSDDGRAFHMNEIHPRRAPGSLKVLQREKSSLVESRLGTMLHERIHCLLD